MGMLQARILGWVAMPFSIYKILGVKSKVCSLMNLHKMDHLCPQLFMTFIIIYPRLCHEKFLTVTQVSLSISYFMTSRLCVIVRPFRH